MPRGRLLTLVATLALALLPAGATAATATGGPTAPLPKHQLTGYWQNFVNDAEPLRVSDVPDDYDMVALAFAESDPNEPGKVTFGVDPELSDALGGYTNQQLKDDIAAKKQSGATFVLSIGGELGNVDLGSEAAVNNFVDSMEGLLTEYGIDGLDVDLEGGLDVDGTAKAIQRLHDRIGDDFVLTMAPQTVDVQAGGAYLKLIERVKDLITVVHTQYYNSGSMNGCDGKTYDQGSVDFITAQACTLLETLRPDQVSFGLPAAPAAAGSGYVEPSVITDALDCLAKQTGCGQFTPGQTTPAISGVMTWSINWDASNGGAFSEAIRSHLDTLP